MLFLSAARNAAQRNRTVLRLRQVVVAAYFVQKACAMYNKVGSETKEIHLSTSRVCLQGSGDAAAHAKTVTE